MKQGKVWGETEELFNSGTVSVHYLKIKKGGYCSEHRHHSKANIFYVIQGNLALTIWNSKGGQDETIIWQGESSEIPPGVYHKFRALTDVECLEIYEVKFRGADIERRTQGGFKK